MSRRYRYPRFESGPGLAWADATVIYHVWTPDRCLYSGPDKASADSIADWYFDRYGRQPHRDTWGHAEGPTEGFFEP